MSPFFYSLKTLKDRQVLYCPHKAQPQRRTNPNYMQKIGFVQGPNYCLELFFLLQSSFPEKLKLSKIKNNAIAVPVMEKVTFLSIQSLF